jgi:peptide chain release factor 3
MLDGAGHPFDLAAVRAGKQTPVYFGSAVNNFGIQLLLDGFLKDSVPPAPRRNAGRMSAAVAGDAAAAPRLEQEAVEIVPAELPVVPVEHPKLSGFVFKIQANMDPKHRDRIAFVRICSGKFERDMMVTHQRSGKMIRLSSSAKLFGQERETVDEAWPGDVVGFVGHDALGIGDTLTEDKAIVFDEIPRFPPEVFTYISNPNAGDAKRYRAGVEQLLQEGVVQAFNARNAPPGATLLAAVGPLQFEVVQWRLESEYGASSRLTPTPWTLLKWLEPHPALKDSSRLIVASGVSFGSDKFEQPIVLFPNDWTMRYFVEKNPELKLHDLPLEQTRVAK